MTSELSHHLSAYLGWMNADVNGISIGFLTSDAFDVNDELLSIDLGDFS